jgi:hypothetical protein
MVVGVAVVVQASGGGGGLVAVTGGAGTTTPRPTALDTPTAASATPAARPSGSQVSASPSASASPRFSVEPSQRPIGFVVVGTTTLYYAADGTVIPVPAVDGLTIRINAGKAEYRAVQSNPYGLGAGAYAGEFRPLVSAGQIDGSSAQTGGLVLVPGVVARLISDQLASVKPDVPRWVVALPVDIRTSAGSVAISYDRFGQIGSSNAPRVEIRYTGSLPVVEAVPANGGYHVLVEGVTATDWQVIDPVRLSLPADKIDPALAMNQLVIYGIGVPTSGGKLIRRDIGHDGKVRLGQVMLSASSSVSISLVVAGSHADLDPDRVLRVGDVPVFVASS